MYCVYEAENEDLLREHARRGGFPFNKRRRGDALAKSIQSSKSFRESKGLVNFFLI